MFLEGMILSLVATIVVLGLEAWVLMGTVKGARSGRVKTANICLLLTWIAVGLVSFGVFYIERAWTLISWQLWLPGIIAVHLMLTDVVFGVLRFISFLIREI